MKQKLVLFSALILLLSFVLAGCFNVEPSESRSTASNSSKLYYGSNSSYSGTSNSSKSTSANSSRSSSSNSSRSSSGTYTRKGPWHSSNVSNDGMGPYPCYGKRDTCPNFTYNYRDLYCDKCDPDGDNVEG